MSNVRRREERATHLMALAPLQFSQAVEPLPRHWGALVRPVRIAFPFALSGGNGKSSVSRLGRCPCFSSRVLPLVAPGGGRHAFGGNGKSKEELCAHRVVSLHVLQGAA